MEQKSYTKLKFNGSSSSEDPVPTNLEEYLSWACRQLSLSYNLLFQKRFQGDDQKKRKRDVTLKLSSTSIHSAACRNSEEIKASVKISTLYDSQGNLIELVIGGKNKKPSKLIKLLGLILPFHPNLMSLTVEPPFDIHSAHEVTKIIQVCSITDLTLDGCHIMRDVLHLFLEYDVNLTKLSLARCGIDDNNIKDLMDRLEYPNSASETLTILNLSSNKITDEGAKNIGTMLRSNKQLCYLNLADNAITDIGAEYIFNSLMEFVISTEEMYNYKVRYMEFIKQKILLMNKLKDDEIKEKSEPKSKVVRKRLSKVLDTSKSSSAEVQTKEDKLAAMATEVLGEFNDPFHQWRLECGKIYSYGNHYLQFLNLAYNKLSYNILPKICDVMNYQKETNKRPRGLMNLILIGNLLPKACKEYSQIDDLLGEAVASKKESTATANFKRKGFGKYQFKT